MALGGWFAWKAVVKAPNNELHPSLDPARLALPLQAACLKCG